MLDLAGLELLVGDELGDDTVDFEGEEPAFDGLDSELDFEGLGVELGLDPALEQVHGASEPEEGLESDESELDLLGLEDSELDLLGLEDSELDLAGPLWDEALGDDSDDFEGDELALEGLDSEPAFDGLDSELDFDGLGVELGLDPVLEQVHGLSEPEEGLEPDDSELDLAGLLWDEALDLAGLLSDEGLDSELDFEGLGDSELALLGLDSELDLEGLGLLVDLAGLLDKDEVELEWLGVALGLDPPLEQVQPFSELEEGLDSELDLLGLLDSEPDLSEPDLLGLDVDEVPAMSGRDAAPGEDDEESSEPAEDLPDEELPAEARPSDELLAIDWELDGELLPLDPSAHA
ncbi:MAG TPA: hypothetical protein VFH45_04355 [Acidimicrobiales bacterium]|nr:hypothetical protein [Acidimicrobiales bacterium]